ncbi:hypothetical protein LUZ60_002964 [Juncus effusus]|nr:hypothetical protein LUZ60_002964 [Juncus effusus]
MATKASIAITIISLILLISTLSINATYNPPKPSRYIPRRIPLKMPPPNPFCPSNTPKLDSCLDMLGGVLGIITGQPISQYQSKCCAILNGLANAEAAGCLCAAAKESVLEITADWSVGVGLVASSCKKEVPDGFKCV